MILNLITINYFYLLLCYCEIIIYYMLDAFLIWADHGIILYNK